MESVDKRMHFFDRQFLRPTDFQAEQAYHLDRGQGHNAGFHSSGVVEGLLVVPSEVENQVNIEPGWAVDTLGREIVLVASRNNVPTEGTEAHIWIEYPDPEPLSDPSVDPGVTGFTRVHEEPVVSVLPPGSIPAHGILLATVSAEGGIDNSVRLLAGLKDGAVTEAKLADNAVSTRTLADDAVTSPKIADDTIQMGNLHPDLRSLIESGGIGDDAILSSMIAEADGTSGQDTNAGSGVKTGHLQDNAVTAAKLQSHATDDAQRAVGTTHLQNSAVTNEKVANNTLFYTKLRGNLLDFEIQMPENSSVFNIASANDLFFVSVTPSGSGTVRWYFISIPSVQRILVENLGDPNVRPTIRIRAYRLVEPS